MTLLESTNRLHRGVTYVFKVLHFLANNTGLYLTRTEAIVAPGALFVQVIAIESRLCVPAVGRLSRVSTKSLLCLRQAVR